MSDPLRTDGTRAPDAASDADRDAKIEQLLLAGLDHYFAAQHEQAINVWTRALFLDRSHPRARAYIDRARSALAERKRLSEALPQQTVGAAASGNRRRARKPRTSRAAPRAADGASRTALSRAIGLALLITATIGAAYAASNWHAPSSQSAGDRGPSSSPAPLRPLPAAAGAPDQGPIR
jgi:hypothetical protein